MKKSDRAETREYTMKTRAKRARETGDRILDAAFSKFAVSHFVDVTVESIAEAAGCSAQTIYRRYETKEGVARALADRVHAAVTSERDEVPTGDIRAAVDRVVAHYEDDGDMTVLLQAQVDRVEVIAEMIARARAQHESWVSRVFAPTLSTMPPEQSRRRHGQLVVALDVQTWKRLRRDLELSREQTALAMEEFIHAILRTTDRSADRERD